MRTFKDLLENILFFVVLARVIGKLRQIFKLSIIRENFGLEKLSILTLDVCRNIQGFIRKYFYSL